MEDMLNWYMRIHDLYLQEVQRDFLGLGVALWGRELRHIERAGVRQFGREFVERLRDRLRMQ